MAAKGRILTGDRPTGRMHSGHYVGSLANRVRLQDQYECFFIVADLHTLTTKPEREAIATIRDNVREMVLDYLAAGIDPEKSTIFLQSGVIETYELNLIFEMLISVARLERVPSLKDMAAAQPRLDAVRLARLPGAAMRRHPAAARQPRPGRQG